jgi:hypothetical protein
MSVIMTTGTQRKTRLTGTPYPPEEELSIDEAICALEVCIHMLVYMKGKPQIYIQDF